jgi:hypothetical protein
MAATAAGDGVVSAAIVACGAVSTGRVFAGTVLAGTVLAGTVSTGSITVDSAARAGAAAVTLAVVSDGTGTACVAISCCDTICSGVAIACGGMVSCTATTACSGAVAWAAVGSGACEEASGGWGWLGVCGATSARAASRAVAGEAGWVTSWGDGGETVTASEIAGCTGGTMAVLTGSTGDQKSTSGEAATGLVDCV